MNEYKINQALDDIQKTLTFLADHIKAMNMNLIAISQCVSILMDEKKSES